MHVKDTLQCTPLHCNNSEFTILLMIIALRNTALFQHLKCQDQRISRNCRSTFVFCSSWNLWRGPIFTFSLSGGRRAPCPPVSYVTDGRCVAFYNFNCVWFVVPTFPESKSKVLLKLCMKLLPLVWNYSVCSQSSWRSP